MQGSDHRFDFYERERGIWIRPVDTGGAEVVMTVGEVRHLMQARAGIRAGAGAGQEMTRAGQARAGMGGAQQISR